MKLKDKLIIVAFVLLMMLVISNIYSYAKLGGIIPFSDDEELKEVHNLYDQLNLIERDVNKERREREQRNAIKESQSNNTITIDYETMKEIIEKMDLEDDDSYITKLIKEKINNEI